MTNRIDSNTTIDLAGLYGQAPAKAQGQYRGQNVTVRDTAALFADAAEELTFASAEKVETKLAKRKIGKGNPMDKSALERAGFYLKQLPDLGSAKKLNQFTDHLKQQKGLTPGQALDQAKAFFTDISHRFAGLSFARDFPDLDREDEELKSVLTQALDLLEKKHGQEIRAGLNITGIAADFSQKGLGKVQEIRAFYRDTVLAETSPTKLYRSVKEKMEEADFETSVGFLIKALGKDLQSMGPSVSHAELKKVMDDLYVLESLKNTDKACEALMEKMGTQLGIRSMGSASELMSQLMEIKGKPWQPSDPFLALSETMGIHGHTEKEIEAQIYFLREIKEVVRQIPLKLFDTMEAREKMLSTMQEALDIAIDKEEEMLS
jgi:type III secretion protein W